MATRSFGRAPTTLNMHATRIISTRRWQCGSGAPPGIQHLAVAPAPRGRSHPGAAAPARLEEHSTGDANARRRASAIQLCSGGVGPYSNLLEPAAIERGRSPSERSRSQTCRYRCESGSREPIDALDEPACATLPSAVAKARATGRPSRRLRRCVLSSQTPVLVLKFVFFQRRPVAPPSLARLLPWRLAARLGSAALRLQSRQLWSVVGLWRGPCWF